MFDRDLLQGFQRIPWPIDLRRRFSSGSWYTLGVHRWKDPWSDPLLSFSPSALGCLRLLSSVAVTAGCSQVFCAPSRLGTHQGCHRRASCNDSEKVLREAFLQASPDRSRAPGRGLRRGTYRGAQKAEISCLDRGYLRWGVPHEDE